MSNIQVLFGNEPYIIDSKIKGVGKELSFPELNYCKFDTWGKEVLTFLEMYPMLDSKRVAVVRVDSMKSLDKTFSDYIEEPSKTAELFVIVKDVDKRTTLYKQLQKKGVLVCCDKITDKDALCKFLLSEINTRGGRITKDAYETLLERERYEDLDEITLYNILSDIDRLISYNPEITTESVSLLIKENLVQAPFGIAKMLLSGDTAALKKQTEAVKGNEIGVLSALLREYRIAWKSKMFSPAQIGAKYITLKGLPKSELSEGMRIIVDAIDGIKNSSIPQESVMMYVFEKLTDLHKQENRSV